MDDCHLNGDILDSCIVYYTLHLFGLIHVKQKKQNALSNPLKAKGGSLSGIRVQTRTQILVHDTFLLLSESTMIL